MAGPVVESNLGTRDHTGSEPKSDWVMRRSIAKLRVIWPTGVRKERKKNSKRNSPVLIRLRGSVQPEEGQLGEDSSAN